MPASHTSPEVSGLPEPEISSTLDEPAVQKPTAPSGPLATVPSTPRNGWRHTLSVYFALTKPRVIELLLVTTIPTMILAHGGFPSVWLILITLLGGALGAASSNVLNCVLDADIDSVMHRTKRRPLVTGDVTPRAATIYGFVLGVAAFATLWFLVNPLSAWLVLIAEVLYVVGYTMILKRRTSQNIVWGGIAGCMPVLVGWTAVTNSLDWAPFALFGVIFFWTPPHYWPLSMRFKRDYANAGVPMLPVVAQDRRVAFEMILYTIAMIACSIALAPLGGLSWVYVVLASVLGGWFLLECILLYRRSVDPAQPKLREMRVFHQSISYLTLLSGAVVVDVLLPI